MLVPLPPTWGGGQIKWLAGRAGAVLAHKLLAFWGANKKLGWGGVAIRPASQIKNIIPGGIGPHCSWTSKLRGQEALTTIQEGCSSFSNACARNAQPPFEWTRILIKAFCVTLFLACSPKRMGAAPDGETGMSLGGKPSTSATTPTPLMCPGARRRDAGRLKWIGVSPRKSISKSIPGYWALSVST